MKIIAFPIMGDYDIPSQFFLSHISQCKIMHVPKISTKTIELGVKNSPDFVCTPFKYTLGTMIECLDKGANVLIQCGGGCRYGYYYSLQNKILKDLGYNFKMYNLITAGTTHPKKIYHYLKEIDPSIKLHKTLYFLFLTYKMIYYMDNIDIFIRKNIGYEVKEGSFQKLKEEMLSEFKKCHTYLKLRKTYKKYLKKFKKVDINKPEHPLKVGLIGELYTLMEPRANYELEKKLAQHNIEMTRFTNVTYLLFQKGKKTSKYLKKLKNVKYRMGADAMDNIYHTEWMGKNKYDGVIHIKSSFCTPEIGSMVIIKKVADQYKMPVLFLSMDTNSSEIGLETRIEAFCDMLEMRKTNE